MNQIVLPYAAVILKLLGDTLYHDDKEWETLLAYQTAVRHHFAAIGLNLRLDEAEGFAYLVQADPNNEPNAKDETSNGESEPLPVLPRLVNRIRFGYDATLLLVLLREELQKFDAREPDQQRLILSREQMREMVQLFYPERSDMTRIENKIDKVITQVERAGFLRSLNNQDEKLYEVRRILKAKVSADKLAEIRLKLLEQTKTGEETEAESE